MEEQLKNNLLFSLVQDKNRQTLEVQFKIYLMNSCI